MVRLKGCGYYAVARGRQVGIYRSWGECESQVKGFPNARFKKFASEMEASQFIETHRSKGGMQYMPLDNGRMENEGQMDNRRRDCASSSQSSQSFSSGIDAVAASALLSLFSVSPSSSPSSPSLSYSSPIQSPYNQQSLIPRQTTCTRKRHMSSKALNGEQPPPGGWCSAVKRAKMTVDFSDAPFVYTDGACTKNGRTGARAGFGVFWGDGHVDNECGPVHGEQTNNRAELIAVIRAIHKAEERGMRKLIVRTDSKLLINSMESWIEKWKRNGWRTADSKDVKNRDLLEVLDSQLQRIAVQFEHVQGHAGIHGNEMADQLARHAAREVSQGRV